MGTASYKPFLSFTVLAGLLVFSACGGDDSSRRARERAPAPVEVVPIENGLIRSMRTYSGSLEAGALFDVAPKVSGRLDSIRVDLGDGVVPGQVLATLEDDEFRQMLAQAEAERRVAEANLQEANNALLTAERSAERSKSLNERGIASDASLDEAQQGLAAGRARQLVAEAQKQRAEAALAEANIRLGYTEIVARWPGDDTRRVVAERFVDAGQLVGSNAPVMQIVDIDTLTAVFFVTERDYRGLAVGQPVDLATDAWPEQVFVGEIARIAPVFRSSSRQARVEVRVGNSDQLLKPGMFVRVTVEIDRAEAATFILFINQTTPREEGEGVFILDSEGTRVLWRSVKVGIREGAVVQVIGEGIDGSVVIVGQQLLEDGVAVSAFNPTSI